MASTRLFKKELNDILSGVIEECYACQLIGDDKSYAKAEKIIEDAIKTFDELIVKLHQKDVENRQAHFKDLRAELAKKTAKFTMAISKLNN